MVFVVGIVLALVCLAMAFLYAPLLSVINSDNVSKEKLEQLRQESNLPSILFCGLAVVCVVGALVAGPYVSVWQANLRGQAILAEAVGAKQAKIEEARAEMDSAVHLKEAEITRAQGVKEANDIIADGLGGAEGYLRYLYIQSLKEAGQSQGTSVIYIPTEAGLPILEANRLSTNKSK